MSCKQWSTLEKITIAPASDSGGGGGGGARAAARFSAGRAAAVDADDGPPPFVPAGSTTSAMQARRSSWLVQDTESPRQLSEVSRRSFKQRWRLRLPGQSGEELGRVLGGGVVPGSLVLVGGEPGVGKSTLLLQVADMLTKPHTQSSPSPSPPDGNINRSEEHNETSEYTAETMTTTSNNTNYGTNENDLQRAVLYVSGEESTEQIGSRAERMGIGNNQDVYLFSATRLEMILEAVLRLRPKALIVDSIQTVYLDDLPSSAGSVVQVRECASALLQVAKAERIPVFLVGHVTKSGDIAGPRVLEHIVDVVVYMEGGRQQALRLVRCVKNRYGATDEVGVFTMEDSGLHAVLNPSAFFLSSRESTTTSAVSSAITVVMEGTRPLLMEVQALCSPTPRNAASPPLRAPTGIKKERLMLILAVLGKHTNIKPYSIDVHINVTGGFAVSEPAADLAIAASIASSYYERPLRKDTAFLAEVGLGGELRPVTQLKRRVLEASKLGFSRIIVPSGSAVVQQQSKNKKIIDNSAIRGVDTDRMGNVTLIECSTVEEALRAGLMGGAEEGSKDRRRRAYGGDGGGAIVDEDGE